MTRTVLMIALSGLCLSGQLRAQDAPVAPETRIGMIDLAAVYEKNERFQALKSRARKEASDFAKQREELEEIIASWKLVLSNENLKDERAEMGWRTIIEARRRLCDLTWESAESLRKLEQERIAVDREIDQEIGEFAVANGFVLILSTRRPVKIDGLRARRRSFVVGTFPADAKAPKSKDITQDYLKHCSQLKNAAQAP